MRRGGLRDLNYVGLLFESLVVRDPPIYAQRLSGSTKELQGRVSGELLRLLGPSSSPANAFVAPAASCRLSVTAAWLTAVPQILEPLPDVGVNRIPVQLIEQNPAFPLRERVKGGRDSRFVQPEDVARVAVGVR